MNDDPRVVLVGGTSHVGKSTTARLLAERLGWPWRSTDRMARHPGRPWPTPPDHVVAHYLTLSPQALADAQLAHYRDMAPMVRDLVARHATDPEAGPLVLEGSGVWPDEVAELRLPNVRAVWLVADRALIEARIRRESGWGAAGAQARTLIERFTARSVLYQAAMLASVRRLGLPHLEVRPLASEEAVADAAAAALGL